MRNFLSVFAGLCLIVSGSTVSAGIIATSGAIKQVSPPICVDYSGGIPSPCGVISVPNILLFQEQSSFTLPSDVAVNMTMPSTATGSAGDYTPGVISAGTIVDSFFTHLYADSPDEVTLSGSMTFDQDILGIMLDDATLYAADPILGFSGTTYPIFFTDNFRGTAETGSGGDIVTLSADQRTIEVTSRVFNFGIDQMRIITTASVPEPSIIALFAAGLFGLGLARRRKA